MQCCIDLPCKFEFSFSSSFILPMSAGVMSPDLGSCWLCQIVLDEWSRSLKEPLSKRLAKVVLRSRYKRMLNKFWWQGSLHYLLHGRNIQWKSSYNQDLHKDQSCKSSMPTVLLHFFVGFLERFLAQLRNMALPPLELVPKHCWFCQGVECIHHSWCFINTQTQSCPSLRTADNTDWI